MADPFASHAPTLDGPATLHQALAANPGTDLDPRPRAIYCAEAGTISITDAAGATLPYALTAGDVLPFRGSRVAAISGGLFYGWS